MELFRYRIPGKLIAKREACAALKRLKQISDPEPLPGQMDAFGISGGVPHGLRKLFMSHPPLEERIAALEGRG